MYLSIYHLCFYHLFIIHLSFVCLICHLPVLPIIYVSTDLSVMYLSPMYYLYFYHLCINQSINYGSSASVSIIYVCVYQPSIHPSMGWALRHTEP